jgi:hypothetical protein
LEQEILGFNATNEATRWTKGSSARQRMRRNQCVRRKIKQGSRKEGRPTQSESKEGLDQRPTVWKTSYKVDKWIPIRIRVFES